MTEHHVPLSRLLGDEPLLGSRLADEFPAQPERTSTMTQTPTLPVTRAKFFVQEVAKTTFGGRVKLSVVSRGQDNASWAQSTPSGSIEMYIKNEAALGQFEPGDEFSWTSRRRRRPSRGSIRRMIASAYCSWPDPQPPKVGRPYRDRRKQRRRRSGK